MRPQVKFKNFGKRTTDTRLIAVVDIGSNSVRLVVFKGLKRNPQVLFNERILCGLGRSISSTGKMDDEAIESAISSLKRFAFLCEDMKVDEVEVIATAATRDADNGPEFIKRVREECGLKIKTISGEEEAKLSAKAVISAFPNVTGIVGDLGGGSLELALIEKDQIVEKVSLPIGPLRMLAGGTELSSEGKKVIRKAIKDIKWLKEGKGHPFYMVGGAWRVLSKLHLFSKNWPIPILHGYQVTGREMRGFSKQISNKSPLDLVVDFSVNYRRLPIMPTAAYILQYLLKQINPKFTVCSSQGIREGVHFKKLNHKIRKKDPFIEACKEIADRTGRFPEHAVKLLMWMKPLFEGENDEALRLCFGCCLLADISWQGHPDFRAEMAFDNILFGHFLSLDHRGRAIASLALYFSYGGPSSGVKIKDARKILPEESFDFAKKIGATIRLGQKLTGGSSMPLEYTSLRLEKKRLVLDISEDHKDLAGPSVEVRLKNLSKLLNVSYEIEFSETESSNLSLF